MKIPKEWTFKNKAVAKCFDKHVREQLPWYDLATGVIKHVATHYIPQGGMVYDVGASTGNMGKAIAGVLSSRSAQFVAIDNSAEMMSQYAGPGVLEVADAAEYIYHPFDLAICFLVLMFIPPAKRANLIKTLREKTRPGGAVVIFDKCLPAGGYASVVMSRLAISCKVASGVSPKEIVEKEMSLSGVQRPLSPQEIGMDACEVFRFGDFAGWIIEAPIKPAIFEREK